MKHLALLLIAIISLVGCAMFADPSPVTGKVIVVDAGHGGTAETDHFRVGPTGEREEWVNLRVALHLRDLLEARGATVLMTRTDDSAVELRARAMLAVENEADVFLSIHHNATADPEVNYPIIYFHGNASENQASVALGRALGVELREALFDGEGPIALVSDHVIFAQSGAGVLRNSDGIPGVIGEASFFTHAPEEIRLKNDAYNRVEAEAYLAALERFFAEPIPPILEKRSLVSLEPFPSLQEAERMQPEALLWRENFERGVALLDSDEQGDWEEGLRLLTLSARAFPDSPVAREAHEARARALALLGRGEEAEVAKRRAQERYVPID